MMNGTEDRGKNRFRIRLYLGVLALLCLGAYLFIFESNKIKDGQGALKLSHVATEHVGETNRFVFLVENVGGRAVSINSGAISSGTGPTLFTFFKHLPSGSKTNLVVSIPRQSNSHSFAISYSFNKGLFQIVSEMIRRQSVHRNYSVQMQWVEE